MAPVLNVDLTKWLTSNYDSVSRFPRFIARKYQFIIHFYIFFLFFRLFFICLVLSLSVFLWNRIRFEASKSRWIRNLCLLFVRFAKITRREKILFVYFMLEYFVCRHFLFYAWYYIIYHRSYLIRKLGDFSLTLKLGWIS